MIATMTTSPETTTPKSTALINFVELWTPEKDRLILNSAIAIEEVSIRDVFSEGKSVAKGDGIAGSSWLQESPVIMQGASAFIEDAAGTSGLPIKSLIAIPVYQDFELLNVIVLGLAPGNGGLEIWTRDDRDELSIGGSYYDGLKAFEFISQYVRFPKGAGLPGSCWKTGRPKMIDAPGEDPNFIRSFDQDPAKPAQCIGLPISREYGFPASILLLLSDAEKPLAQFMDVWRCETVESEGSQRLKLASAHTGIDREATENILRLVDQSSASVLIGPDEVPAGYRCGLAMPF